jgi:hypothetical protein
MVVRLSALRAICYVPAAGVRKWNILDVMEIPLPVVNQDCFAQCHSGTLSRNERTNGQNFKVTWIARHNVDEFIDVIKFIPTTDDQKSSLNSPSCEHMTMLLTTEEEEKEEEIHSFPVCPGCKNALMALSLLDSVIISSGTNERFVKSCGRPRFFLSKVYKGTLKKEKIN